MAKQVKKSGWTTAVIVKAGLITPYRISGKIGDTIEVNNDILDELLRLKKVELA